MQTQIDTAYNMNKINADIINTNATENGFIWPLTQSGRAKKNG